MMFDTDLPDVWSYDRYETNVLPFHIYSKSLHDPLRFFMYTFSIFLFCLTIIQLMARKWVFPFEGVRRMIIIVSVILPTTMTTTTITTTSMPMGLG